jgi:hypothetical protein
MSFLMKEKEEGKTSSGVFPSHCPIETPVFLLVVIVSNLSHSPLLKRFLSLPLLGFILSSQLVGMGYKSVSARDFLVCKVLTQNCRRENVSVFQESSSLRERERERESNGCRVFSE